MDDVSHPPEQSPLRCLLAISEVTLAFAAVHIAYRFLQTFTPYGRWEVSQGLNFITGSVMVLATVGLVVMHRTPFTRYGLSSAQWRRDLSIGLKWLLITAVVGGTLAWLLNVRTAVSRDNLPGIAMGGAALMIQAAMAALFAWTYRTGLPPQPKGVSTAIAATVFLLLAVSPLPAAAYTGTPIVHTLLVLLWMGFSAGIGEEMFFRGYIQSRVNETCGRPWKLLGVQFGIGLLVSALLFGLIHAINFVDYFRGQFVFAWGFGVMTIGLLYSVIRERTGSIWPGAVMHILTNILGRTALLLTADT